MNQNQGLNPMQSAPANAYLAQQMNQAVINTSQLGQPQPTNPHLYVQQAHYLPSGHMQQYFPGRNEAGGSGTQPAFSQALPNAVANSGNLSGEGGINQGFASFQPNLNRQDDKSIGYHSQPTFQPQHRLPAHPSLETVSSAVPIQLAEKSSMHSATKPALELRLQHIHPSIMPKEILENLECLSTEALCALGREIIQDLLIRAMNLFSVMKLSVSNTNRNAPIDVESIMTYCQTLFNKLAEVRIRIDLKRSAEATKNGTTVELNTRISDEKLFEIFSSPPPTTKINTRKQKLTQEFEANRAQLVRLSNQMKKLDWLASVSDPRFLRKD